MTTSIYTTSISIINVLCCVSRIALVVGNVTLDVLVEHYIYCLQAVKHKKDTAEMSNRERYLQAMDGMDVLLHVAVAVAAADMHTNVVVIDRTVVLVMLMWMWTLMRRYYYLLYWYCYWYWFALVHPALLAHREFHFRSISIPMIALRQRRS